MPWGSGSTPGAHTTVTPSEQIPLEIPVAPRSISGNNQAHVAEQRNYLCFAEVEMPEEKWTIERIHKEITSARATVFVVTKVLETGSIKPSDHPEWVLVIKPLLDDLTKNADRIRALLDEQESQQKQD